ncbi:hypothetical protein ACFQO4_19485 [Saliphagus sp. GCM10025334]|uniref:hypothetical protein n=1 Tax=Natronosalvus caseinilyticus TaxID=2953747 RepID=UPI0028A74C6D|nr:hypothetical protein [Natronosalvus caseinilyticus]
MMSRISFLLQMWNALSRYQRGFTFVFVFCSAWAVYLALTHPDVTWVNVVAATIGFSFIWVVWFVIARGELAIERLSDPEYFLDEKE